jgi:hypothetical protein
MKSLSSEPLFSATFLAGKKVAKETKKSTRRKAS